ncbi:hypothetical protein [Streptomyces sp. NBC_00344]|uniref:hypothetical protein n=1 Tax=Streptomyces sp. NBC_00344 TaxID=2975720 RepID=UPI002E20732F
MFGPNPAPPAPSAPGEGARITMRVGFAVASFLTCGMLACLPLFRIAIMRGRWYDWAMAWLSLPVSIGGLAVIGALPETDHRTDVALACVLLLGAGSAVYFVIFDIRDMERKRQAPAAYFASPQQGYAAQTQPQAGYGYPRQTPVPLPHPGTHPQQTQPQQPRLQQTQPQHPQPQHPQMPQRPPHTPAPLSADRPPHRIDQVRAELDELSDLLRKDTDGKGEGR